MQPAELYRGYLNYKHKIHFQSLKRVVEIEKQERSTQENQAMKLLEEIRADADRASELKDEMTQ